MRLIIQRYLAFNFILPLIVSTLFFVSFLLTFQLFRVMKLLASKDVPLMTAVGLMGHISVTFLPVGVPLSVLFATLYTYGKMGQDSELIAMRSLGITKFKLFSPVLIMCLFIAGGLYGLNQNLIPFSNLEFRRALTVLTSKGLIGDIKKGQFFTEIPKVLLFANDVQGSNLSEVFLRLEGAENVTQVIHAKRGMIEKGQETSYGSNSMALELYDGNMVKYSQAGDSLEKVYFERYKMPVVASELSMEISAKESMKSSAVLESEMKAWDPKIGNPKDLLQKKLEYFSRINTPLLVLVFALLGLGLGVQRARGKNQNTATMSLGVLVVYYMLFFLVYSLATKGLILPEIAIFLPTLLLVVVGGILFRRLDWVI